MTESDRGPTGRSRRRPSPARPAALLLSFAGCLVIGCAGTESAGVGSEATGRAALTAAPSGFADDPRIQLGPRPHYLIERLPPGLLRSRLELCREGPFTRTRFSIGHRGAPLQFPEHTRESYLAAARMGAGVIECDVVLTADRELVCRHSQCDLHSTTNILESPLAVRCSESFEPAEIDPRTGETIRPARARCCTSDLTLEEFVQLEGRMDASNPRAQTVAEFLDATPAWRTDLYANGGTLMSHADSLRLFNELGVAMAPELKAPTHEMPFQGSFDQRDYATSLLHAYLEAGIAPEDVLLQSFERDDIRTWLEIAPAYGERAVWLDERDPLAMAPPAAEFEALYAEGFRTIAPPISMLLRLDEEGSLRASPYALRARAAGLELISWSLERSGRIRAGRAEGREDDFYYGPILSALEHDGGVLQIIHALVQEVGVRAIFSDWPATTTYYANCFGLE